MRACVGSGASGDASELPVESVPGEGGPSGYSVGGGVSFSSVADGAPTPTTTGHCTGWGVQLHTNVSVVVCCKRHKTISGQVLHQKLHGQVR